MNSPNPSPVEVFRRLLDDSTELLCAPADAGIPFPDDNLHREILLPLLPAMLGDEAIRKHWHDQTASGFPSRLARHLLHGEPAPRWHAADFEIHVTASYSAGPDARALADTLLSEDSLRDLAAALMNQILDALWAKVPLPTVAETEIAPTETEEVLPVPEVFAAVEKTTPSFVLPPLPAAVLARRRAWRAMRRTRQNPIRDTKSWRRKIGRPIWSAGRRIARGTTRP